MTEKNYLALFAKSFNWAGFFLPKNIYNDCSKLYAFCRVLDDLVDEKIELELRIERFSKKCKVVFFCHQIILSKTLADERTPGTPAPGWVPAPTK